MGKHGRPVQKRGPQNAHTTTRYPSYIPDDDVYEAKTLGVKKSDENLIGDRQVQAQLAGAPAPRQTGKSGYPHEFLNKKNQIPELAIPSPASLERTPSNASSTTNHYEFPVFADGHTYDYGTKKKEQESGSQGHIRAITNQNGRLKGVIAHNGKEEMPHTGPMHWLPKMKYSETHMASKEKK